MSNLRPGLGGPICAMIVGGIAIIAIAACGGTPANPSAPATSGAPPTVATGASPTASTVPPPGSPDTSPEPYVQASSEPDTGTGTTSGDVPDNAVFLTYRDAGHGFSIQYVEGWQVVPASDGVTIRDKDSSETVLIVPAPADLTAWVSASDLPALHAQLGFKLIKQDTVKVGSAVLTHLSYHLPAPPDPVTGKQVPSTVDRYYLSGPQGLAVISLSTPDGVDNVDAFRQMIENFSWN